MNSIQTSAPGKVFIAGEYAVLDGAPAICMAVDCRAYVSIAESDQPFHSVIAPGRLQTPGRFYANSRGLEWLQGEADYPLLTAVWEELAATPRQYLSIVLDSNEFADARTGVKYGVGSSAALTVALAAALCAALGRDQRVDGIARDAHRKLQNGAGSGADIACSLHGGVIAYRINESAPTALQWPTDLHYALLWSGVSANTTAQLTRLAATAAGSTRAGLCAAASKVAATWPGGQSTDIIAALHEYAAALRRFDDEHALGIHDAGHAGLAEAAESCGVVYKPCGAGCGDLGIVMASDRAAVDTFASRAQAHGFTRVRMSVDMSGLRRDGVRP
ncbi:MAG: hypothetical protein OEW64_03630 [Gammaproteobacteria bacterium]|nr:hypothetical protein [Gammaproteobacteria bacterium]